LIHCSTVPACCAFATTRRAVFQLVAWYKPPVAATADVRMVMGAHPRSNRVAKTLFAGGGGSNISPSGTTAPRDSAATPRFALANDGITITAAAATMIPA